MTSQASVAQSPPWLWLAGILYETAAVAADGCLYSESYAYELADTLSNPTAKTLVSCGQCFELVVASNLLWQCQHIRQVAHCLCSWGGGAIFSVMTIPPYG